MRQDVSSGTTLLSRSLEGDEISIISEISIVAKAEPGAGRGRSTSRYRFGPSTVGVQRSEPFDDAEILKNRGSAVPPQTQSLVSSGRFWILKWARSA
jgi:hypothetical protein